MTPLDLLFALGQFELTQLLFLAVLLDIPRYLIAALFVAVVPPDKGTPNGPIEISALVSAHNEEKSILACLQALQVNRVDQIVVIADGCTDTTAEIARAFGATVIELPERVGKPNALNIGLVQALHPVIVVVDADTLLEPGAVNAALALLGPGVGGVGMRLRLRNEIVTLTTTYQAIEYRVLFSAGRRLEDALGILPNISGAAGLFRREALAQVGGWDCEVAEDAALAMKLRDAGWRLRHADTATAATLVPETVTGLLLQRLRWDASVVTIWWRKFGFLLNPVSHRFRPLNLLTSLDVLVFNVVLPLILPFYIWWLWGRVGSVSLTLLAAVLVALTVINMVILMLVRLPLRLLPYVPYHVVAQNLLMRPLRVIALLAEFVFSISRYDQYIPKSHRDRLT
jgi:cellulose synthase/poly-beta-1,6-N-acetylglucosamine synthase-like glycosyltransferase